MQALSLSTEIIRTYKASSLLRPLKALTKEVFSPKSSLYIYRYLLKKKKKHYFLSQVDICGYSHKAIYQKRKKVAACSTRESHLENTNGRMKPVSSTNKLDEKYANVQHISDPVPEHMVPARKRQKKKKMVPEIAPPLYGDP